MKKILILLFLSVFILGCNKKITPIEPKEVRIFWGKKEEIKVFLDSPSAVAERWLVQSLGE